jgi:DeoR/GlpR family transcriptional regulator of sugar metabolism
VQCEHATNIGHPGEIVNTREVDAAEAAARADRSARRERILDRLREQDFVSVNELAEEFGMTTMSLRRDLNALAEDGQITRVRGGAKRARSSHAPRQYLEAEQRNAPAKTLIARFAVDLLSDATTAFFYSGSTVARVASAVPEEERSGLTVVTMSLPVINEVSTWAEAHLVAVGGVYLPGYMAFVGPQAVGTLRGISADVAVLGCDGISAEDGLTTPHQLVAEVGSVLIERARRTIVVADSTKIGRRGFTPIAPAKNIDVLVTDGGADPAALTALRNRGVEVHVV